MTNLEYTNQNSQSRYPFKDNAPLTWSYTSFSAELPNTVFLDAQVTVFNQQVISPRLKQIVYNFNTDPGLDSAQVIFAFIINDNTTSVAFNVTTTSNLISLRSASNSVLFRFEIDPIELLTHFRTVIGASGTAVFDNTLNALCASSITYVSPTISNIAFENLKNDGTTETVTIIDNSAGVDLKAGTNLDFSNQNNQLVLNVVAGAGQGLYNACELVQGLVYKINNIAANTYNNYSITGDTCYDISSASNGINIANTCKPECSEEELQAFAHYLNRIKSGALDLANYITQTKSNFDQIVAAYIDQVNAKRQITPPYILAETNTASNRTKDFNTISCAIYSPSKQTIPVSLSVTYDSMFTLVDGTSYITQDGSKKIQNYTGFDTRTLKCNDVLFHGFVISDDRVSGESPINKGDPKFDVKFNLVSPVSTAYFSLPLLSQIPNYSVAYTKLRANGRAYINMTIELFHKEAVQLVSSLMWNFPPEVQVIDGNFSVDNTTVTPITTIFGFKNADVDYSKKATCSVNFTCDKPAGTNFTVEMILTTPLGFSKKFIPFTA